MSDWPILSVVTFLPLVGVIFILACAATRSGEPQRPLFMALWTSLFTFLVSLSLWFNFETGTAKFQFVEEVEWLTIPGGYTLTYHMGVDGISMFFVLLSTLLTPICVLASWEAIKDRVREYMIAFLVLETLMIGTFCALDLRDLLRLLRGCAHPDVPDHRRLGRRPDRVYSAFKFFLYTLPARF